MILSEAQTRGHTVWLKKAAFIIMIHSNITDTFNSIWSHTVWSKDGTGGDGVDTSEIAWTTEPTSSAFIVVSIEFRVKGR